MKKILIVSDGVIGHHFIQRVIGTHTTENRYYIIHPETEEKYKGYNPDRFRFFHFDPTSYYKISAVFKTDFTQVMLVIENRVELEQTIKNRIPLVFHKTKPL